jgi:hypothetical protein
MARFLSTSGSTTRRLTSMNLSGWKDIVAIVESVVKISAIAVGGLWAYSRFVLYRERWAIIEAIADIQFLGKHGVCWIVELSTCIENKGKAQLRINSDTFKFDCRILQTNDSLEDRGNGEIKFKLFLPREDGTFCRWLSDREGSEAKRGDVLIEPGTKQKYSFLASLPPATRFAMLYSSFEYPRHVESSFTKFVRELFNLTGDQGGSHSTGRIVRVPDSEPLVNVATKEMRTDEEKASQSGGTP